MYTATGMLSYDIFENMEARLRYTYVNTESNIAIYDYDRNVISAGLEYRF